MENHSIALISTILAAVLFLAGMLIINKKKTVLQRTAHTRGLKTLEQFRHQLSAIQQHRGLMNGYLNGDTSLSIRLRPLKIEIHNSFETLNRENNWLNDNEEWASIHDHWQRLAKSADELSHHNSFEQHSKLIANLLYVMDDYAQAHTLYEIKDKQQQSIRYIWQDLLQKVEYIGQARAIGTGVLAAGHCSSVERIRIRYLSQTLEEYDNNQYVNFKSLKPLLTLIEQEVLIERPVYSPSRYFDAATLALNELFEVFDKKLDELAIEN